MKDDVEGAGVSRQGGDESWRASGEDRRGERLRKSRATMKASLLDIQPSYRWTPFNLQSSVSELWNVEELLWNYSTS